MTNLIAKVAELREMEARAEGIEYFSIGECELNYGTVEFLENMRIAAPELLAALGKVQAGDADEIDYAIQELTRIFGPDNVAETIEVLHRHADLARTMEGNP